MAHAVVIEVRIEVDSDMAHRHQTLRDYVIPDIRALTGFQRASWMNDRAGTGMCIAVFETEDNAKAAVPTLLPPGPAVISTTLYEVEIDA
jgi:hypothetical protein